MPPFSAIAKTFGTYMLADYLSNWIQHPTEKMDYGVFNRVIGREVDQKFWGTRTEHIVGVAAGLAVTDFASQAVFNGILGRTISFAATPKAFLLHTFGFIAAGVAVYCAADAAFNPIYEGQDRMDLFKENLYATVNGSATAWHEPLIAAALMASPLGRFGWLAGSLLPATAAYSTVKGFGWRDWGKSGLNPLEKRLNGVG